MIPSLLFIFNVVLASPVPFHINFRINFSISTKGFPGSSAGKESTCNAGDPGLIPGSGKICWKTRKGYPLQYSGLENSMDRIVHGVAKSCLDCLKYAPKLSASFLSLQEGQVQVPRMKGL